MKPLGPVEVDVQAARNLLAENAFRLRKEMNLTQLMASERAGLDIRHWQKVERQETNATLETIARVAAALEVRIAELFRPLRSRPPRRRSRIQPVP